MMEFTGYQNDSIRTWDNFLPEKDFVLLNNLLMDCSYKYGEVDRRGTPPTGLVSNFSQSDKIFKILFERLVSVASLQNLRCIRSYINLFSPNERPYFHSDNTEFTALFYPNLSWGIDDGGETKFILPTNKATAMVTNSNDKNELPIIISVAPIPNRLVVFKGDILHAATSIRNLHRLTIAFKFVKPVS